MARSSCRWPWAALFVGWVFVVTGCNPAALTYLLMLGEEPKIAAECPLYKDRKEAKVAIVADAGVNYSPELGQVDRQLSERLADVLRERFKANGEKVTIIPPHKVFAFKERQRDWRTMSLQEIGKHFEADYVINLDISSMGLFEEKSRSSFYRGRTEISVKVVNVNKPEGEGLEWGRDYVCQEYPRAFPVETTSMSLGTFRGQFINYVAESLSHYFTSYPSEQKYKMN
jgi:hypothetical protein